MGNAPPPGRDFKAPAKDNRGNRHKYLLYIGLYREQHKKSFFSETTRPRALIFGM